MEGRSNCAPHDDGCTDRHAIQGSHLWSGLWQPCVRHIRLALVLGPTRGDAVHLEGKSQPERTSSVRKPCHCGRVK